MNMNLEVMFCHVVYTTRSNIVISKFFIILTNFICKILILIYFLKLKDKIEPNKN